MKLKFSTSVYTLISLIIAFFLNISLAVSSQDNLLPVIETYFEPKHFGFVASFGGSSHYNWVLTILDEVVSRGHNATLFTTEDNLRFGKPFPRIQTVSFGPKIELPTDSQFSHISEPGILPVRYFVLDMMSRRWKTDFTVLMDHVKEHNIDVLVCDHLTDVCFDVAKTLKKPFVATSVYEQTKDSAASGVYNYQPDVEDFTSEFQSLYKRFVLEFIKPFRVYLLTRKFWKDYGLLKISMGVEPITNFNWRWRDNVKLVNNFYGITPPRRAGPLVEHVGVIVPSRYTPLSQDISQFLDKHSRVSYVAFGQHSKPKLDDSNLILSSLLEVLESGEIDGILWSTSSSLDMFPRHIKTSTNNTYTISDLFEGKHPHIVFHKWVPQFAVLLHPSTQLFVSHGGMGSLSESLYAGVRMALFPFFADQPGNSKVMERHNVGRIIHSGATVADTVKDIKELVLDKSGNIEKSIKRMQALIQLHSRDGPRAGATVLEEVAFSSVNDKIPHRYEVSRRMSFIKAHNIDIYAIFVLLVLSLAVIVGYTIKKTISYTEAVYNKHAKVKTN